MGETVPLIGKPLQMTLLFPAGFSLVISAKQYGKKVLVWSRDRGSFCHFSCWHAKQNSTDSGEASGQFVQVDKASAPWPSTP